jgi:hypothetical protein
MLLVLVAGVSTGIVVKPPREESTGRFLFKGVEVGWL